MGTTPHGINGPIKGKVGTVHGSSRNGKPYIKGPSKKRTTKITATEAANRVHFDYTHSWLKPITEFVREGFRGFVYKDTSEGYVAAYSYLIKHALEGEKPNRTINPALMQVSYGSLPLPKNIAVEQISSDALKFTWDKEYVRDGSHPQDQVMLLAYEVEQQKVAINVLGQFRDVGEDYFKLGPACKGYNLHIYVAFVAADRSRRSHSVYLGPITIA